MEKMSAELNRVLGDVLDLHSGVGSLSCHRWGTNSLWTGSDLWATL